MQSSNSSFTFATLGGILSGFLSCFDPADLVHTAGCTILGTIVSFGVTRLLQKITTRISRERDERKDAGAGH